MLEGTRFTIPDDAALAARRAFLGELDAGLRERENAKAAAVADYLMAEHGEQMDAGFVTRLWAYFDTTLGKDFVDADYRLRLFQSLPPSALILIDKARRWDECRVQR